MLKRWGFSALLFLVSAAATAQTPDDEYYPYAEPEEHSVESPADSVLFYRAIQRTPESYDAASRFALPRVTIRRRGEHYSSEQRTLYGIPIAYRHTTSLRLAGAEERYDSGLAMQQAALGTTAGVRQFHFTDNLPLHPWRVAVRYADRNYRVGAQIDMEQESHNGWHTAWGLDYRTGRDARIEGLFTDALTVGGRLSRRWAHGGALTVVLSAPLSIRGLRSASTEEAFELTDDPYYNPSWGFQDGKVRNARVRREAMPLAVVAWAMPLSKQTTLQGSLGAEMGLRAQSELGWYDARTPQPDNYRNMPSYTGDLATEAVWREEDARYTQVAWDELIAQNRLGDGAAIYALEDAVTRLTNLHLRAALHTRLGALELDYGLYAHYNRTRHYRTMRDLLGADYLLDIDHYLIDDDSYSNRLQNDLRNPSRHITEGDRFGYDYALVTRTVGGWLRTVWHTERWHAEAALAINDATCYRRGYYEKELFAGNRSYGKSRTIRQMPYTLKGVAGYTFSPRSYLALSVAQGSAATTPDHLFIQPRYNNRTVDATAPARFTAAQLHFRRTGEKLDWQLTTFLTLHRGGVESRRYYDDLAAAYCDIEVADLATRALGIEAAVQWRPAYRWTLSATASWGDYRYVEDATVTVLTDAENRAVDRQAVSHLRDCRPGGVPALTASAAVRYYGPRGWSIRLSGGVAAERHVDAAALRRTDRVAYQSGSTPESFEAFTRQERLDDAVTLDASIFKHCTLHNGHQLWFSLQLTNLTACEVPSSGYESMRSQRYGTTTSTVRMPQASRYLYASPRSVLLTAGYRF